MSNYYERLGVSPSATSAEIKTAFMNKKKDAQRLMVSKNSEEAKKGIALVESLTEAYKVLSSADKRKQYDQEHNISEAVSEVVPEAASETVTAETTAADKQIESAAEDVSVEEEYAAEETVSEEPVADQGGKKQDEHTAVVSQPIPTVKPTPTPTAKSAPTPSAEPTAEANAEAPEPKQAGKGRAYEPRQVNENRGASNKNGLLIGGGAVLIVIVIILLGYIGYQAFSDKDEVQTKTVVTYVEKDASVLSDSQFADYCYKKEIMNSDIANLATEINNYIASHGDLRGATIIQQKCQDLRFNVETTLREYQQFSKHTQMERDLERLMELELVRIKALEQGVAIGLHGGKYTDGFRDGSLASQKFKKLNKAFNAARGSY